MKIFLLFLVLLLSIIHSLQAQLGVSNIGISVMATDSIGYKNIGKAATPKCAIPGSCNSACAVYTFIGSGNWDIEGNWEGGLIPPAVLTGCFEIVINPTNDAECFLNMPMQMLPPGSTITVMAGKRFRVPGDLIIQQH
jgi:hypothetical protein